MRWNGYVTSEHMLKHFILNLQHVLQVTYGSNYIHMMCLMVPGVGNNQLKTSLMPTATGLNNDLYHPNLAHRPNKDQKWDYYTLATHEDNKMAP
ncbi:hypothetical protein QQ045_027504 [Rhodiola kirilowii]